MSWDDKAPKGFNYKDKAGTEDGVTKASLKTGAAGETKVSVSAKGAAIPMPATQVGEGCEGETPLPSNTVGYVAAAPASDS